MEKKKKVVTHHTNLSLDKIQCLYLVRELFSKEEVIQMVIALSFLINNAVNDKLEAEKRGETNSFSDSVVEHLSNVLSKIIAGCPDDLAKELCDRIRKNTNIDISSSQEEMQEKIAKGIVKDLEKNAKGVAH